MYKKKTARTEHESRGVPLFQKWKPGAEPRITAARATLYSDWLAVGSGQTFLASTSLLLEDWGRNFRFLNRTCASKRPGRLSITRHAAVKWDCKANFNVIDSKHIWWSLKWNLIFWPLLKKKSHKLSYFPHYKYTIKYLCLNVISIKRMSLESFFFLKKKR